MQTLERNEVNISGTVFHKEVLERTIFLTVTTGTYYKDGRRMFTSPTVIFTGNRRFLAESVNSGDSVNIHAYVMSGKKHDSSDRTIYNQLIMGDSLSFAYSPMEDAFGIKSRFGVIKKNEVILCGSVYSISTASPGVVRIIISVPVINNNRRLRSRILCTYFANDTEAVLNDIHVRDKVCAAGTVRTREILKDGKSCRTDQIVLNELQKL